MSHTFIKAYCVLYTEIDAKKADMVPFFFFVSVPICLEGGTQNWTMIQRLAMAVSGANKEQREMKGWSPSVSILGNKERPHREGYRPKLWRMKKRGERIF